MNRNELMGRERLAICACLIGLAGSYVFAQTDSPATAGAEQAADDSLKSWEYVSAIPLQEAGDSPWADFVLTPEVFDGARLDLADLRLYDARQGEVPYALRELRAKDMVVEAKPKPFNKSEGADGVSQLSLDLGESSIEHNEVQIKTPGAGFRRRVIVEGSDDGEQWSKLAEKALLNFREGDRHLVVDDVQYSPCRYRYVRLTVYQDPQVDQKAVPIESAVARRRVTAPGEDVVRSVPFTPREATRTASGPGSKWTIDLGGENVPCDRLIVTIDEPEFVRDYYIEAGGPQGSGDSFRRIASGTWRRRAGEESRDVAAKFDETKAARLRLFVTDHSNDPLNLSAIQVSSPARQVVFAKTPDMQGPLKLYFGCPKAGAPNYDFARNLAEQLSPPPDRHSVGARETNPIYEPAPLPLTERLPWLIYAVLGFAVAVLALLIANLAAAAIRASDAREAAPS